MEIKSVKNLERSEVEIIGNLSVEEFAKYRKGAIEYLGSKVNIPGFRQGKVPENVLVKHVGEMAVLEEMAERALAEAYPKICEEKNIRAIGRPQIAVTKLAPGNPLEFTIRTAVSPEITLPDYKAIAKAINAKKEEPITVEPKELENIITEIRKSRVDHSKHDHSLSKEEHDKQIEKEAPELTDEFVKTLGNFKDVADFREKLEKNVRADKERKAREKKRLAIVEEIVKNSKIEVPDVLIETELAKMLAEFNDNITRMGLKPEDYLNHIKKTEVDLRKEWRPDALKRAKLALILWKIAETEKVVPSNEELDKEVEAILSYYKDADKDRARAYAETVLANEKVFLFLEKQ